MFSTLAIYQGESRVFFFSSRHSQIAYSDGLWPRQGCFSEPLFVLLNSTLVKSLVQEMNSFDDQIQLVLYRFYLKKI